MLREVIGGLKEPPAAMHGNLEVEIGSLAADSRATEPGALFFALPGQRTDGDRFVSEALARGAVAVVARGSIELPSDVPLVIVPRIERAIGEAAACFYDFPSRKLVLVGITGTNGKTTTTYLVESIWRAAGLTPGVIGTVSYRYAEHERPAPLTTPQPIELQKLLAEMVEAGVTHVIMEVSSHALALGRVEDCNWDAAIFTNLTRDHLDFHPNMESYFEAKARLFTELLPRSRKSEPLAVVHLDDPYGKRLLERLETRAVTFGRGEDADVGVAHVAQTIDGLRGELRLGGQRMALDSKLIGDAHLQNVLAAAAVTFGQGLPPDDIASGLRRCEGVPGRMERIDGGAPFAVLVDYAHTPDALERALRALAELADGRLIVVFGCGGDRDRGKRPIMGDAAARLADLVVLTSDNPRTEDPNAILEDIEAGIRGAGLAAIDRTQATDGEADGYVKIADRREAIHFGIEVARPGDVVLIAGKGHEPYQIVGTERRPFDDRSEARRSLAAVSAA